MLQGVNIGTFFGMCTKIPPRHVTNHENWTRRGWGNRAAVGRGGAPIILGINDCFAPKYR